MDFRAALVNNINARSTNLNPRAQHFKRSNAGEPARITSPAANQKALSDKSARRRRRRRNNALNSTKTAIEALLEEDEEPVLQEHTPPYTPLRGTFDIPTLQVVEASPVPSCQPEDATSRPPARGPERVPIETLHAIAEHARERLSVRIQAYWEEKKKVAEAAETIQKAYATHMESQLGTIITAMQGQLSTSIDNKLDSFKQAWKEEISNTFSGLENNPTSHHPHGVDPKIVKTARISALEKETQKLITTMSNQKEEDESSDAASNGDMLAVLKQLQARGEKTDRSLKELLGLSQKNSLETKELREAMKSAGLLPHDAVDSSSSRPRAQVEQLVKGRHSFTVYEDKENVSFPTVGLSSPFKRSNQNVVVTLPHHL